MRVCSPVRRLRGGAQSRASHKSDRELDETNSDGTRATGHRRHNRRLLHPVLHRASRVAVLYPSDSTLHATLIDAATASMCANQRPSPSPPAVGVALARDLMGYCSSPTHRPCAATLACTSKALASLSAAISRRQLDLRFHRPSLTISRRPNLHFHRALASLSAQSAPPPEICAATQTSTAPS